MPSPARRWACRALLAGLLSLLTITSTAGAAEAHTSVRGSTPANGATVRSLDSVSVQFVDPVLDSFAGLALTTEDDRPVQLSEPAVSSDTITATIDGPQPGPGLYIVSYRAVSVDGHTITGSLAFTLDPPTTASGQGAAAAASTPAPSRRPEGTPDAPSEESSWASVGRPLALGGGVGVALLAGAALWALRRRGER